MLLLACAVASRAAADPLSDTTPAAAHAAAEISEISALGTPETTAAEAPAPTNPPENLAQFVREALENAYTTDDDKRAVRLLQDGLADAILEVGWDDDADEVARSFSAKRDLRGADAHAVLQLARDMKQDSINRRDLKLWAVCVDDVLSSGFEMVVAQNYAPVFVEKGATARGFAEAWCKPREIWEAECDMIASTICREAVARGFATSTPAQPTGAAVTAGARVMALRDGAFQLGVAASVGDTHADVVFEDGSRQNTSLYDVRALPAADEPPQATHPSYVWAAVAALQAMVLGLVVLRDHRRLAAPEPRPPQPREVSPQPIIPKARDWGARRRRSSQAPVETPSRAVRRSLSTAPSSAPDSDALAGDRVGLLSATPGSRDHERAWRKMWATSRGAPQSPGGDDTAFRDWYATTFPASPRSPQAEEEVDNGASAALMAAESEIRRANAALGGGDEVPAPGVAGGD